MEFLNIVTMLHMKHHKRKYLTKVLSPKPTPSALLTNMLLNPNSKNPDRPFLLNPHLLSDL